MNSDSPKAILFIFWVLFFSNVVGGQNLLHAQSFADSLRLQARADLFSGNYAEAHESGLAALELFQEQDSLNGACNTRLILGYVCLMTGRQSEAEEYFETIISEASDSAGIKRFSVLCTSAASQLMSIHLNRGEYDSAMERARYSIALDREMNNYGNLAITLQKVGNLLCLKGRPEESVPPFTRALFLTILERPLLLLISNEKEQSINTEKIGLAFNDLGTALDYLGQYRRAHAVYSKALEYLTSSGNAQETFLLTVKYNLANMETLLGQHEEAVQYGERILSDYKASSGAFTPILANFYSLIGQLKLDRGDAETAELYFKMALEVADSTLGKNAYERRSFLSNLGNALSAQNKPDSAMEHFKKALEISPAGSSLRVTQMMEMAEAESKISPVLAEKRMKTALRLAGSLPPSERDVLQGLCFFELGKFYFKTNRLKKAGNNLRLARKTLPPDIPNVKGDLAENAILLAKIHQNEKDSFYLFLEEAIRHSLSDGNEFNIDHLPELSEISHPLLLLEAYITKSELLLDLPATREDSLEAAFHFGQAHHLLPVIRPYFSYESGAEEFYGRARSLYDKMLPMLIRQYGNYPDESYLDMIVNGMAGAKSMRLRESLNQREAVDLMGIPKEILEKEKRLSFDAKRAKEELNSEKKQDKIPVLQRKVLESDEAYDEFRRELENSYPSYFGLKYGRKHSSIEKISKAIPDDAIMLEYYVSKEELCIVALGNEKAVTLTYSISADSLKKKVHGLIEASKTTDAQEYFPLATELYTILLKDILDGFPETKKIIIVPDGSLGLLPFEMLIAPEKNEGNPGNYFELPYLIRNYEISYLFSGGTIKAKTRQENKRKPFWGISPRYSGKHFPDLPFAEKEVLDLSDMLGGEATCGKIATAQTFRESPKAFEVIHIAGHATANPDNPMASAIHFSEEENDSDTDISVLELYHMDIPANMVVLSACSSGTGKLVESEGIMSMARGFAEAGCPSTLTTLWPVGDQPTYELMLGFYNYLRKGLSRSEALRKAKIDFIDYGGAKTASPYFWAGAVLIGDDEPVYFQKEMRSATWFLIGIAVILGIPLIYFFNRKNGDS